MKPELEAAAVLDAGCGANHHPELAAALLELGLAECHFTGLDVDADALAAHPYLHERIVGDVETAPLPRAAYDVVICWDVLEHVGNPLRALANLASAVKPGGMMLLVFPNLLSLKGLATKLTPHRFHRWVYRRLYRAQYDPYPTVLAWSMRPSAVRRWAERQGFLVNLQLRSPRLRMPFGRLLGWRSECRISTHSRAA